MKYAALALILLLNETHCRKAAHDGRRAVFGSIVDDDDFLRESLGLGIDA